MKNSPQIRDFFPNFQVSRSSVSGLDPVISCANLFCDNEGATQVAPLLKDPDPRINPKNKIKEYASLASYAILEAIAKTKVANYQDLVFRKKCQEMVTWIGSVKSTDSFDYLMKVFELTGFGNVMVEDEEEGRNTTPVLVTLGDIVSLYRTERLKSELHVSDVGSEKISLSADTTISDALFLMLNQDVRRVFISRKDDDGNKNPPIEFVSDRRIFCFLFSNERLKILNKTPELWLVGRLSEVKSSLAKSVPDESTINQSSELIGEKADACLVCETSNKVVSRWDIAIKPWQVNSLEIFA